LRTIAGRSVAAMAPTPAGPVLLVCGSLRAGSTNAAVLRTAADIAAAGGVATDWYDGLAGLPAFNPDDDHDPLPAPVADLRARIAGAGAVLVCTPEYAGDMPGSLKNLLDWTVGGVEIEGKPTGWINASALGGAAGTHAALRTVLTYTGAAVVEPAAVAVPVVRQAVGDDGRVADPASRAAIAAAVAALAAAAASSPATTLTRPGTTNVP
jgi:NAD(P)H-dependent FMN reductase